MSETVPAREADPIRCRVVASPECLGDGNHWSFYLINDEPNPLDSAVLEEVVYEWGGAWSKEAADVRIPTLAPGAHAILWRGHASGAELRMDLMLRVCLQGREARLRFEFPMLYRKVDLPLIDGLGKPGWQETGNVCLDQEGPKEPLTGSETSLSSPQDLSLQPPPAPAKRALMTPAMGGWILLLGLCLIGLPWLISWGVGWQELSRCYPARHPYRGEWITRPSIDGGLPAHPEVSLNHSQTEALRIGADRQGLHLSVDIVFRLFHPPVFVPWGDLRSERLEVFPGSGKTHVRFTFASCPDIPLDVDRPLAGEIQKLSEGQWSPPKDP